MKTNYHILFSYPNGLIFKELVIDGVSIDISTNLLDLNTINILVISILSNDPNAYIKFIGSLKKIYNEKSFKPNDLTKAKSYLKRVLNLNINSSLDHLFLIANGLLTEHDISYIPTTFYFIERTNLQDIYSSLELLINHPPPLLIVISPEVRCA